MKIYYICPNHPYYTLGGVETVVQKLAEGVASKGFDITIITFHPKKEKSTNRVNVQCFKSYNIPLLDINVPEIFSFVIFIRKIQDSIIHIHAFHSLSSFLTLLFADGKSNKIVFSTYYHGRSSNKIRNRLFKIYKVIFKLFLGKVDTFISISEQEKNLLVKQLKIAQDKVKVIPSGYDFSEILKYKWKVSPSVDGKKILYVGRLVEHKNPDKLVQAVSKDIGLRLTIVGSGHLENKIKKIINEKRLGDRIEIKKELSRGDLLKEYCKADIFILPSLNESYGIVVGEAALVGCPVIVAESQALIEFVKSKIALGIKPPITPEKLLEKIYSPNVKSPREKAMKILNNWEEISGTIIEMYQSQTPRSGTE